jgi:hypothetical protein
MDRVNRQSMERAKLIERALPDGEAVAPLTSQPVIEPQHAAGTPAAPSRIRHLRKLPSRHAKTGRSMAKLTTIVSLKRRVGPARAGETVLAAP